MTTINTAIQAAENYKNTQNTYQELCDKLNKIEKDLEIDKAFTTMKSQLKEKHKVVAETINQEPEWFTNQEFVYLVMDCMRDENKRKYLQLAGKHKYVNNAIHDNFSQIFNDKVKQNTRVVGNNSIIVPSIRIDASTTDKELEDITPVLESFLTTFSHYSHSILQETEYHFPVESYNSFYNDKYCEIIFTTIGEYKIAEYNLTYWDTDTVITTYPQGENTKSLLNVLKEVRDHYWFSDMNNIKGLGKVSL